MGKEHLRSLMKWCHVVVPLLVVGLLVVGLLLFVVLWLMMETVVIFLL